MDTAKSQVAFWIVATVTIVWIAYLALAAVEHEQQRTIDLGPDCTIYEDGSATCLDDQGGWHFEEGTF